MFDQHRSALLWDFKLMSTVSETVTGIPGFDDTDLPRLVGFFFGSLIILNHAVSLESMTGAQLVLPSPQIPTTWKLHTLTYANAHNQLSVTEVRGFRDISSFSGNKSPICRPSPQSMNRYPSVWVHISSEPFRIARYTSCSLTSCTPPVLSS